MEVKLFLNNISNKDLLKIKKYTNLPMTMIKSEPNNPFFSFIDFEDFERNNYDINVTNKFKFFKDLIFFLTNENINFSIENYNNLEELEADYDLNNKIIRANNVLDELRESYPDCESWEENINNQQRFFIKIDGITYDGIEMLKGIKYEY